jgi:ATP-dependent DNA helicase MPH1
MQVIEKFKKNDYNCLVATSIGEEGLDIGEVDFIVIYNCPKTSIKAVRDGMWYCQATKLTSYFL